MSIALLVITDGREEYLDRCVASLKHVHGNVTEMWMYDDTGDETYRRALAARYPQFNHINGGGRRGFGGAIAAAWAVLAAQSTASWVFHVEQDFEFGARPIDLDVMAWVLHEHPYLLQMALRRQAWSQAEGLAGGVVEQNPEAYEEVISFVAGLASRQPNPEPEVAWLEHRLFWTTNPAIYRRAMCTNTTWPPGARSEGRYTHHLIEHGALEMPGHLVRFGYWGARDSGVWVEHIGHQRIGRGY